jgi:hypothetical protein
LWVRILDHGTKQAKTEDIEIPSDNLNIDDWWWVMPGVDKPMDALMQISLNK